MLSYRHAFHAGNPADVLKHSVLVSVLDYLLQKPKPLYLLDTHAGAGLYDLISDQAAKTGEAKLGIERVLAATGPRPALIAGYEKIVRASLEELGRYPGTPALLVHFQRAEDRVDLHELHPTDFPLLEARFGARPRVRVCREDGFQALLAKLPPTERRGLVIIDPSYEIKSDYDTVVERLAQAHRRFATGVYILWYPVIDRARVDRLMAALEATAIPRQLRIEFCLSADQSGYGMTGSGLVVINPPFVLEDTVREALPWLAQVMGADGPQTVSWLVGE